MANDDPQCLAVHYFKTSRVRHWISQELFLNPEFLVLKVYSAIANVGIDFVPAAYPTAEAFGSMPLPCAFIQGQPASSEAILRFVKTIADIDAKLPHKEEREALAVLAQSVISDAIEYTHWGFSECFFKFTQPVMRDSMPRPAADLHCAHMRAQYVHKDLELLDSKLRSLFKFLCSKIRGSKFFFFNDAPSTCDVVLYSYLSVLLSIPEQFSPFAKDHSDEEVIHRLRSFLLDFDDYLWQLNANRAEHMEAAKPLPSAELATIEPTCPLQADATTHGEGTSTPRPFLGEEKAARTQNIIFLSAAAAVMAGVIILSNRR